MTVETFVKARYDFLKENVPGFSSNGLNIQSKIIDKAYELLDEYDMEEPAALNIEYYHWTNRIVGMLNDSIKIYMSLNDDVDEDEPRFRIETDEDYEEPSETKTDDGRILTDDEMKKWVEKVLDMDY